MPTRIPAVYLAPALPVDDGDALAVAEWRGWHVAETVDSRARGWRTPAYRCPDYGTAPDPATAAAALAAGAVPRLAAACHRATAAYLHAHRCDRTACDCRGPVAAVAAYVDAHRCARALDNVVVRLRLAALLAAAAR